MGVLQASLSGTVQSTVSRLWIVLATELEKPMLAEESRVRHTRSTSFQALLPSAMLHRRAAVMFVLHVTAWLLHWTWVQLPVLVPTWSGFNPRLTVFFKSAQDAASEGGSWYSWRSVAQSETPPIDNCWYSVLRAALTVGLIQPTHWSPS
jgi:hypothetical protein